MEDKKAELGKLDDAIKDTLSVLRQEEKKEDGRYIVDKYTTPVYVEVKEGGEEQRPYIHMYSDINTKGIYNRAEYYEYESPVLVRELKGAIIKLGLETKEQKERQDKLSKETLSLSRIIKTERLNLLNISDDLAELSNTIETIIKNKERLNKEYPEMADFYSASKLMYGNYLSTEPIELSLRMIQEKAEQLIEQLQKGEEKYYG